VPGDTRINILVASTHRNPNYFPTNPHPFGLGTDINDFKPGRWFVTADMDSDSGIGVQSPSSPSPSDTETKEFFRPQKGAFIPFSIGQRECIGKRFARIEMLAVLAVLFKDWSVELIVEGEGRMSMGKRWMAWEDERERVRENLRSGMEHYMTMQLGKGLCPMRIVKRGQEKYSSMR
jgi:cytochrome P450